MAEAIESAAAQSALCDVVVVDNDSSDETLQLVRSRFPAVRTIQSGANLGFAAAANLGAFAEGTSYDFVAFLNADARAKPAWIERVTAWMDEREIDVASSVVNGSRAPFFAGGRWHPFLGAAVKVAAYAGEATDWVSGCAMIVRREVFERLGGFDPAYFLYYEDVDLSLRASARGMRLGVYAEPLVDHPQEGRSSDRLGSLRKRRIGLHAKGICARRFVPFYAVPSALAFQCLVSPAANGALLREYPALVGAFFGGFFGRPGVAPQP